VRDIGKELEIYINGTMCHSTSPNGQGNGRSNSWEEEARRQNQLYPDLSELLDSMFSSQNPNATSQTDQDQRQSVLRNILSMFASNISPEHQNTSGNQQPPPSAPPEDTTERNEQHSGPHQSPPRSSPNPREENNPGFNRYDSRMPPQGMPWNYQYQGYQNIPDGAFREWAYLNNRSRYCTNPELSAFLSALLVRCVKTSAALAFLMVSFLFVWLMPHTLLAIGLAIAVIRSITRIPMLPLIAGCLFICGLLYLDSQFLMLLCVWTIFKCVVMGRPLMNREFWRRCFQMDVHTN